MSDTCPLPPNALAWWDVTSTTGDALAILRLTDTDVDAARIAALVAVAGQLINNHLDRIDPLLIPVPAPVDAALTYTVINLYRQKDSPPATADDFGLSPGYVPADPLQPVRAMLAPYRQRVGVS